MKNLTREEIISKFREIYKDAVEFDKNNDDPQVVNLVLVNWIGFSLDRKDHPFLDKLDIDRMIFPKNFPLT